MYLYEVVYGECLLLVPEQGCDWPPFSDRNAGFISAPSNNSTRFDSEWIIGCKLGYSFSADLGDTRRIIVCESPSRIWTPVDSCQRMLVEFCLSIY